MSEEIEEIYISTLDAIRLTELARISAFTQTEFGGFVYGLKKHDKFYLKGIVPVFEKGNSNEVDNQRTEIYVKMLKKSNPEYLFFQYHSHPNGFTELSKEDLDVIKGLEIILWAEAEFGKNFLRKKVSRVSYGLIKAYKVLEENGEKKIKEVPIKIKHSHKL
jgi:proteasome lid subunit RPN8/RPN11